VCPGGLKVVDHLGSGAEARYLHSEGVMNESRLVVVGGGGLAGLSAAVYACRSGF
jgi:NADPH-dependent 2,4-dienoyl-CoA reductase/sulfur reductase-like enzyme